MFDIILKSKSSIYYLLLTTHALSIISLSKEKQQLLQQWLAEKIEQIFYMKSVSKDGNEASMKQR